VGVRGSRIKNIVEVLGGVERIDIVRWNDSLQVLIPNALQPAAIEEVFLYPRLERAVVLVKEDQLSLAIGRRGQNVRLASKLVGWDIEIMTHDELNASIEKAEEWFRQMPGITDEMVEALIEEGFLSYEDIDFLKTHELMELTGLSEEDADEVLIFAGEKVEEMAKEPKAPKAREAAPAQQPSGPPTTADKVAKLFPDVAPPAPAPPASAAAQAFESLFSQSPPAGQAEAVPQEEAAPEEAAPPAAEEEWPAEPEESAPPAEGAEVASGAEGVEPAAPTTEGAQPAPAVPAPPEQPHVEGQGEQGEWRG
jgi:N utilization substance protein A